MKHHTKLIYLFLVIFFLGHNCASNSERLKAKQDKKAEKVRDIFNKSNTATRVQWERINQKGFDFANDNQITEEERMQLEEQGMPTFTINRSTPVVELLNFYATANNPRWQAVGVDGSDADIASLFSDLADYIWSNSDGSSLYANAIKFLPHIVLMVWIIFKLAAIN